MTPVYKLSASSITGRTTYGSMLAGNTAYVLPGDFESIATSTPSGTGTLTFSSIPATYAHLQIRGIYSGSVVERSLLLRFNSDTAGNYSWHELSGNGTSAGAGAGANATGIYVGYASNTTTNTYPSPFVIDILDYANTNKYKTVRSLNGNDLNGSGWAILYSGNWRSTSAVDSITLYLNSGNYNTYSHFALYGIRSA